MLYFKFNRSVLKKQIPDLDVLLAGPAFNMAEYEELTAVQKLRIGQLLSVETYSPAYLHRLTRIPIQTLCNWKQKWLDHGADAHLTRGRPATLGAPQQAAAQAFAVASEVHYKNDAEVHAFDDHVSALRDQTRASQHLVPTTYRIAPSTMRKLKKSLHLYNVNAQSLPDARVRAISDARNMFCYSSVLALQQQQR